MSVTSGVMLYDFKTVVGRGRGIVPFRRLVTDDFPT